MIGCSPGRAAGHRRLRRTIHEASPRVISADEISDHETELTLRGTGPVPPAVAFEIAQCGVGIALVQDNGDSKKVLLR